MFKIEVELCCLKMIQMKHIQMFLMLYNVFILSDLYMFAFFLDLSKATEIFQTLLAEVRQR